MNGLMIKHLNLYLNVKSRNDISKYIDKMISYHKYDTKGFTKSKPSNVFTKSKPSNVFRPNSNNNLGFNKKILSDLLNYEIKRKIITSVNEYRQNQVKKLYLIHSMRTTRKPPPPPPKTTTPSTPIF